MMATTELDKIPETVLSRSQVYEFRTIGTSAIADQLRSDRRRRADHGRRRVAAAHRARRRRQHARRAEQARSGDRVHRRDHHGRRRGDRARAGRARPAARHDSGGGRRGRARRPSRWPGAPSRWATTCAPSAASCRASCATCWCCRSIRRASTDPEIAGEGERDRLKALGAPLLARGSAAGVRRADARRDEIRNAAQPRYHLEMALLRWIHLRKLVSIEELIAGRGDIRARDRRA